MVRSAFAAAGHDALVLGVSGRGADLLVASRYLITVRAMHGSEAASAHTQLKWWQTIERRDGTIPVMVVRGSKGFITAGWSAWLDGRWLTDGHNLTGVPVRLWFEDFVKMGIL